MKPRSDDEVARRCAMGCENWPNHDRYRICPQCGEPTRRYSDMTPITHTEARAKVAQIEGVAFDPSQQKFCSICAHDIEGECPHPWDEAFEFWPKPMLEQLRSMVPTGPSAGS